ncbi:hypothetical protein OG552_03605 [Streptomyces sp. NBC_01476]|uniref:hypothetical protein n=1 Tax=Streptomyces sp. NBC_01476 TaxID=2903881 RepID=UPI002E34C9E4|nr:hypothetical protein [Streptomyces sp. NBC_01476]
MGFSGDFVVARSDQPLLELPPFAAGAVCGTCGGDDCSGPYEVRPGGWQTLRIQHGPMTDDVPAWLDTLAAATGAPALLGRVADSGLCQVWGTAVSGASWTTFLDPVLAARHGIPVPDAAEVPRTARRIAAWAAEAGCAADHGALLSVLTRRADPFAADLFRELVDACGLPPAGPGPAAAGEPDVPAHPGHRADPRVPRGAALEAAVLRLAHDRHLVLECATDLQCYAQVWLRPDGTYQLEYRDRSPAEHYWTRTGSVEEVIAALTGWVAGEVAWRESFQWASLAGWFTEEPTA